MYRHLIAALLSAALALSAAPATADPKRTRNDNNAALALGIAGGIAALIVLKRQADKREAKRDEARRKAEAKAARKRHAAAEVRRERVVRTPPAAIRAPHNARLIPEECYRTHRTFDGLVSGYGARCMQNRVARPGLLPPDCIRRLDTDRGPRNLYAPRCLRRDGWTSRTARR